MNNDYVVRATYMYVLAGVVSLNSLVLIATINIFFTPVYGWLNGTTFEGAEQGTSYNLLVGFTKGSIGRQLQFTLNTTTLSTPPPGM